MIPRSGGHPLVPLAAPIADQVGRPLGGALVVFTAPPTDGPFTWGSFDATGTQTVTVFAGDMTGVALSGQLSRPSTDFAGRDGNFEITAAAPGVPGIVARFLPETRKAWMFRPVRLGPGRGARGLYQNIDSISARC
ncbi:hypothetical protein Caci_7434 [Catenulispora acidiphila DSM 44928]|uniref:Uncharacterized protein n=1 Tax=Catenulispora acidiphila (strain DSM 44928 / JCM 14897 / NBRC 102108 / NRRL B-24433 / ID139908) TaxID=479433 RepID=C7Q9U1_CATAD|nr:hypothetical protein [Catenulispora acidiphila]ACU72912.1 hypothetical protein Caci_4045 [Catenulispora acidiphila DSM 44928]ACU76260.1 hypothetical protein Caci_7434 [Catenulispora acidiphila DSM 44928]